MLIPEPALLFERLVDTALQIVRNGRIQVSRARGHAVQNRIINDGCAWSRKGLSSSCHFIKEQAQREQIRSRVDFLSARLLRRHVRDRPKRRSRSSEVRTR